MKYYFSPDILSQNLPTFTVLSNITFNGEAMECGIEANGQLWSLSAQMNIPDKDGFSYQIAIKGGIAVSIFYHCPNLRDIASYDLRYTSCLF